MKIRQLVVVAALNIVLSVNAAAAPSPEQKQMVKAAVHSGIEILKKFHGRIKNGCITEKQYRVLALSEIDEFRFDGQNYLYLFDKQLNMLLHPIRPSLKGKNFRSLKDPVGNRLFLEYEKVLSTSNSGYVSYFWQKPGVGNAVEKISYVEYFEPWDIVVGAGIYVD